MWFYEQYQQESNNPKKLVQNRAAFRAELRERRLAAMKFFGFSPSRPWASSDPWNAPVWRSNHFYYPRLWSGYVTPAVVVHNDLSPGHTD